MFSLGYREKAVPNIDIWHAHLKSSLEEPSHPTLHKFISINVLWPIAEILHASFSVPEMRCIHQKQTSHAPVPTHVSPYAMVA